MVNARSIAACMRTAYQVANTARPTRGYHSLCCSAMRVPSSGRDEALHIDRERLARVHASSGEAM